MTNLLSSGFEYRSDTDTQALLQKPRESDLTDLDLQGQILFALSNPQDLRISPLYEEICGLLNEELQKGSSKQLDSLIEQLPWLSEDDPRLESDQTWLTAIKRHMNFTRTVAMQTPSSNEVEEDTIPPLKIEAGIPLLIDARQIDQLLAEIFVIHLSARRIVNGHVFSRLLNIKEFPELRFIQIPKSLIKSIGPTIKDLLRERPDVILIIAEVSSRYNRGTNPVSKITREELKKRRRYSQSGLQKAS